jgi:hypothetical protein
MTVYMAGVLAGSLGTSLSDPNTFIAGASGGVYALIAAHLVNTTLYPAGFDLTTHSSSLLDGRRRRYHKTTPPAGR